MAFTASELTEIRRHCGYPVYGAGATGFQGWRFFQAYGVLEYRLGNLASAEEVVVRTYLTTLASLEAGVVATASRLDTAQAAVWTRNADERSERTLLFDDWRRRLCAFLGVPTGPGLPDAGLRLVV